MQMLSIPASYEVWFTDLKHHLDSHPGSKAALAKHLTLTLGIKMNAAMVKVSKLLARQHVPAADTFIDIALWLQNQTQDTNDPSHNFSPRPPLTLNRRPPAGSWREPSQRERDSNPYLVAEDPPESN